MIFHIPRNGLIIYRKAVNVHKTKSELPGVALLLAKLLKNLGFIAPILNLQ